MSTCLSDNDIRRLDDENLDPALFAAWETHVEECPRCQDRLAVVAWSCAVPKEDAFPVIPGYVLEEELGRGATGVVYRAHRADLDRTVALKVLFNGGGATGHHLRERRRWLREARAAARVEDHPNVVRLYDCHEAGGRLCLVLEYVPGGPLGDRMGAPAPPRAAAEIVEAVARAVEHIHQRGWLHLDLKPGNILLNCSKDAPWHEIVPKVADFSVSLLGAGEPASGSSTTIAGLRGTPSYMSPEQTLGDLDKLGRPADVHALGAVLYALLTGRPPYQAASESETMEQVRNTEPVPPRRLVPKLPRDLETITLKCLEKNPSRRYESARSAADDLRRWLDGKPIQARPVSWLEHGWRYCRRQPRIAASFTALAAIILISLVGLFILNRNARKARAEAEQNSQRAEAERSVAEQNLQIASELISNIDQLVIFSTNWSRPDQREQVGRIVNLLREQVAKVRRISGSKTDLLVQLVLNNARLSTIIVEFGMTDTARRLARENIDYIRECRARNPWDNDLCDYEAEILTNAGHIERSAGQVKWALGYLDEASSLLLNRKSGHPRRLRLASLLSDEYLQLGKALADNGHPDEAKQARDGQIRLLTFLEGGIPERPDRVLLKACAFADHGEWDRACQLIRTLATFKEATRSDPTLYQMDPKVFEHAVGEAMEEWCRREGRHWRTAAESQKCEPEALDRDREADRILDLLAQLSEAQRVDRAYFFEALKGVTSVLAVRATEERREGRIDGAERTVTLVMVFAQRLMRRYPEHPQSYFMLGQAYMQQSKNAWKRDDMEAIKRGLELSIKMFEQGLALDPDDILNWKILEDYKARLAALPKS